MTVDYKMVRAVGDYLLEKYPRTPVDLHELAREMEADLSYETWDEVPEGVLVKVKSGPFEGFNLVKLNNRVPIGGFGPYLEPQHGPFQFDCEGYERV